MQAVKKQKKNENGGFILSTLERNKPIYFAIDNVDLAVDTSDGKNQLHGTGTVVYQEIRECEIVRLSYFIEQ